MENDRSQHLERAAEILRAASEPTRLELLLELRAGERSVTELSQDRSFSAVSQRLRVLRAAGLVVRRREGKRQLYALRDRALVRLLESLLRHASELS